MRYQSRVHGLHMVSLPSNQNDPFLKPSLVSPVDVASIVLHNVLLAAATHKTGNESPSSTPGPSDHED